MRVPFQAPTQSASTTHMPDHQSQLDSIISPPSRIQWILVPKTSFVGTSTNSLIPISSGPDSITVPLWNLIWAENELHKHPILHSYLLEAGCTLRANIPKALHYIYHYRPLPDEQVRTLL